MKGQTIIKKAGRVECNQLNDFQSSSPLRSLHNLNFLKKNKIGLNRMVSSNHLIHDVIFNNKKYLNVYVKMPEENHTLQCVVAS